MKNVSNQTQYDLKRPTPAWICAAAVLFCVFVVVANGIAPGVNESHYLTKARHFWDKSFGAGDLFLESKDAHWFFFLTFGWLAKVFPLVVAAYVGRIICWIFLSVAWCYLAKSLTLKPWLATLSGAFFVTTLQLGHLSGEWVVGGFEAKCIAYACIFVALGHVAAGRWSAAWPWLGFSCAFHVVTGGWVTLTVIAALFVRKMYATEEQSLREQVIPLAAGGLLSLLGLVPAIILNVGSDAETSKLGAMIYVYDRLPHHLLASRFALYRWQAFTVLLTFAMFCFVAFFRRVRSPGFGKMELTSHSNVQHSLPVEGLRRIWIVVFAAFLLGVAGLLIDRFLSSSRPELAAALLRYYWFRWNDVAWPLTASLTLAVWHEIAKQKTMESLATFATLLLPSAYFVFLSFSQQMNQRFPDADRQSLLLRTEPDFLQERTYRDWRAVCRWIEISTDEKALWLTPRYQQTFKWYTGRSEFVCWKDAPQDAVGLVAWRSRLREAYTYSETGALIETPLKTLLQLNQKYQIKYLLVDRRIQKTPPLLPIVYPMEPETNDTFMVFEFLDMQPANKSQP
jgi:hypothetical protein